MQSIAFKTPAVLIKKTKSKGFGVFAAKDFKKDEIIEISPIVTLSKKELYFIDETKIYNYYFTWNQGAAIAFGYASFYNHSYKPNALYIKKVRDKAIAIIATQSIKSGEEITVNYNGDPKNKERLWFYVSN